MVRFVDDDQRVRRGVDTRLAQHEPPSTAQRLNAHAPRPTRKRRHQHVNAFDNVFGRLARRDDEPLADKERQRFVSRHEKDHRIRILIQHLHHTLNGDERLSTARRRKQHRNRRASHGLELLALVHRQPREPHHNSRVTLHERAAINVNIDAGAVDAELSEKRRLRGRRARRTFGVFRREESVVREQTPAAPTHGSIESQFPHRFAGELLRELRGVARQGLVDRGLERALEEHGVAQPGEGRDVGDA